jgi:hypothetical protein
MTAPRWTVLILSGCLAGATVVLLPELHDGTFASPAAPQHAQPPRAPGAAEDVLAFRGMAGCSARGCHGRSQPQKEARVQQNEYSLVLALDKHLRAYEVLSSERGQQIAHALGIANATEDARCLACHTIPQLATQQAPTEEVLALRQWGVTCEACHGASSRWLIAHTDQAWQRLSPQQKQEHGMTPMQDLAVQAAVCAGCHVGAPARDGVPARDCNHDIMAAGHPRLNFELSAFRANLPPHWNKEARKTNQVDTYKAKVWAVGQIGSARASLELLADRAGRAATSPWPEFAEYSCYACHGDLGPKVGHLAKRASTGRHVGSLPYSTWYSAELRAVAEAFPPGGDVLSAFRQLQREMSNAGPASQKLALATSNHLREWLTLVNGATFSEAAVRKMLSALAAEGTTPQGLTWDEAEQLALAAATLSRACGKNGLRKTADDVLRDLEFPSGREGPRRQWQNKGLEDSLRLLIEQLPR